jgi:hypothetical protein
LPNHFQRNLSPRTIATPDGNAGFFHPIGIGRLRLWQVPFGTDAEPAPSDLKLKRDGNLPVAHFAERAAVLPGHARRVLALLHEARAVDDEHAFYAEDAANAPPHVGLDQRVLPVALVDELLERLELVFLRLMNHVEPTGHRLDAFAITVDQQPAETRRAPVFPLAASDAGGYVLDERLHLVLTFVTLPSFHERKHGDTPEPGHDPLT